VRGRSCTSVVLKKDAVWISGNASGMRSTIPSARLHTTSVIAPTRRKRLFARRESRLPEPAPSDTVRYGRTVISRRWTKASASSRKGSARAPRNHPTAAPRPSPTRILAVKLIAPGHHPRARPPDQCISSGGKWGLFPHPGLSEFLSLASCPRDAVDRHRLVVRRDRALVCREQLAGLLQDRSEVVIVHPLDRHRLTGWLSADHYRRFRPIHRGIDRRRRGRLAAHGWDLVGGNKASVCTS